MCGGEVEGVEHRKQPDAQSLGGTIEELGLLAHGALPEVVEVGLQAAEGVEVLVTLGRHEGLFGLGFQILLRLSRVGSPVHEGLVQEGVQRHIELLVHVVIGLAVHVVIGLGGRVVAGAG